MEFSNYKIYRKDACGTHTCLNKSIYLRVKMLLSHIFLNFYIEINFIDNQTILFGYEIIN